jgi:hypothetical protein
LLPTSFLCVPQGLLIRTGSVAECGSGCAGIRIKLKGRIRISINVKSWIRIRICIKVISWIRIRINLQMRSPNVWKMSLFKLLFTVLSLYFEARIRIRIWNRIKVKGRIRIHIKLTSLIRIRIRIKVTNRIRIRINVMRIRNTAYRYKIEKLSYFNFQ